MTTTKDACLLAALLVATSVGHVSGQAPAPKSAPAAHTVLFVCEHGAAKSVIAAAHFNKIARERGLPYRAVARGTAPDADVPNGVRQGLEREELELVVPEPMRVSQTDAHEASRVITFEIALPNAIAPSSGTLTNWRAVPSVSADFGVASADIKRRVEALIDELMKK